MACRKSMMSLLLVLATLVAGCSSDSGPLRAKWNYAELTKDDSGEVKESGDKHSFQSGGDEMYPIRENRLEVVTVTSTKATFRSRGHNPAESQEAELHAGECKDLWLGPFGIRLRLEAIGPIQ